MILSPDGRARIEEKGYDARQGTPVTQRHFFTLGCSNQTLDVFCAELKTGRIDVVLDVPQVCRRAILVSAGKAKRHVPEA